MGVDPAATGARLKQYRNANHLTQEGLSGILTDGGDPASRVSISMWESGKKLPTLSHMVFLRELYGCTGTPDEGVLWTPDRQFAEIRRIENEHPYLRGRTITGVAEYIKAWNSMVRIVAVEPAECAAISGGFIGQHSIAGIGPGFVPENYNPYVVDTVLTVTSADAERAAREVLFFDGVPACTSAGATLAAAVQLMGMGKAKRPLCVFAGRRTYE